MELSKIFSRKQTIIAIATLITAILILTLLPYGIGYGIVQALHGQGAEEALIENVDFNPFTGRLVIQNMSIREGGNTPLNISELSIQISWLSLFKKRIYLEELILTKSTLSIEEIADNGWKVGGLAIPLEEKKEEEPAIEEPTGDPWGFGIEHLAIRSSMIKFNGMGLDTEFEIKDFNIANVKSWEPKLTAALVLSGDLNRSGLIIKTEAHPFSSSPSVKGTYSLDKLSLTPLNPLLPKDWNFSIESGNVSSAGSFQFTHGQEENLINFRGGITVEDLSLADPSGIQLLALKKLELREIAVDGLEKISVSEVDLEQMQVIKPADKASSNNGRPEPLLETDRLLVSGISTDGLNDISIQSIELKGSRVFLLRRPDSKWHLIDDISEIQENGEEKESVEEEEKPLEDKADPLRIRIADITIEDNNIRFEDESVEPHYRTELVIDKVALHDIDTSAPEKKSTWTVEGKMGDYSTLNFSGNIQPFAEKLTIDLSGNIEELDLQPLSPYTVKTLGYNVKSGHLDSKIDMKITSGNIESENEIVLKKLEISPKDETKMDALVSELGLSLESMLSLLRDGDGTIRLNLPIEGDVDNPDIKLGEIINKALGQAMKKTAFTYLKNAFQPYGALITIVQLAGEAARIKLDPVEFEAGAEMLNESAGEYMKTVVKLLNERPELEISICGKVTQDDINILTEKALQALREEIELSQTEEQKKAAAEVQEVEPLTIELSDEELLGFARSRAVHIKKLLTEEHGIDSGRLFICNPEIKRDEKETPRVDLLI